MPAAFFLGAYDRAFTNAKHPCRISDATTVNGHPNNLLFNSSLVSFVAVSQHKALRRAIGMMATATLDTVGILPRLHNLVTAAVGANDSLVTCHVNDYMAFFRFDPLP